MPVRSRLVRFAGHGALGLATGIHGFASLALERIDDAWRLALVPEKGEHRGGTRGS